MTTTTYAPTDDTINRISTSASAYLDRLQEGHEKFAEVLGTARTRAALVNDKLIEVLLAGQRDALDFGKTVAGQPGEVNKNLEAAMHALTAAQERALDFTKVLFRVQAEAAADARAFSARLFEGGRGLSSPLEKLAALWTPAAK
jgi:hypothetical protein